MATGTSTSSSAGSAQKGRALEHYIEALKRIPGCRLSIIDLAWKIAGEDGEGLDDKIMLHRLEVEAAVMEAKAYVSDTRKAILLLCQLARLNPSPTAF